MKKSNPQPSLKTTILNILNFFEEQYGKYKGQKVKFEDSLELLKTLAPMLDQYIKIEPEYCIQDIKKKVLPIINLFLRVDKDDKRKAEYLILLEEMYRIGACYDFSCFLIYYEWEEEDKLFEKRYSILHSYVYYLNEMAHDPKFELIIANLPSGYGKTRIVKLYEAWRLGLDPKGTFLDLCSNDTVVKGGSRSVIDIIKSERYGLVFPYLSYQNLGKDLFLKETDGEWKVKQCQMLASYYASTTNSNVVGQRASLSIHIDDLYADYKEALDENLNMYYFNKYLTVWRKRYVQNKTPQVIISGTMWSPTDFIVKVIDLTETENKFIHHPKFKYTKISDDGKKVIIQVPALDPETDKSTCEDLRSTIELHKERRSMDTYLWETNFQQNPTTPEGLEFDWKNLDTYDETPINEYKCCYAVIDGTRKSGKDFFAMPIFQNYYEKYAMIDCIFTKTATSELIDDIISKIIDHHIVKLVIETNVDGGLKRTLEEKLHSLGVYYCNIYEKYNTVPKKIRIECEKGNIVKKLVYPSKKALEPNTDMSKYMQNLTLYNSSGKNANDDAPDSSAMFTSEIIGEKAKLTRVKPMKRPF